MGWLQAAHLGARTLEVWDSFKFFKFSLICLNWIHIHSIQRLQRLQFTFDVLLPTFKPVEPPPPPLSLPALTRFKILIWLRRCPVCRCAGFPSHTWFPKFKKSSRKTKSKMNSLFPHTWLAPGRLRGITKGLSVWMGMTVAKSQTHTVYTIRFVWFNQRREHVGAARQWSAMCLAVLYTLKEDWICWGTTGASVNNFYGSINTKPWFLTQTFFSEYVTVEFGEEPWPHATLHTSNWTVIFSPSLHPPSPFIPAHTSHVSAARGREKPCRPFSTRSCTNKGKVEGLCCRSTWNVIPGHFFLCHAKLT